GGGGEVGGAGGGGGVSRGGNDGGGLGDGQGLGVVDGIFLQLGIERQHDRPHGRRHGDLVGAHRRFGEVLQRGGLVVPFHEVAEDGSGIDRRVHPFGAGCAFVGFDDVAAHDDDRHAIAPGVVHRHAC